MFFPMRFIKIGLKEPLLHFLLMGMVLFGLYQWLGNEVEDATAVTREVVVSQGRIRSLAEMFTRLWNRPPTQEELEGLVRDYIREEVMYREALALGLDRDDTIIRRRLRQKMEFLSEDVAVQAEPTEAELRAYLRAHANAFRVERRFTFLHVYLNPGRHGDRLDPTAVQLLAELRQEGAQAEVVARGDTFLLGHSFDSVTASEVAKLFGEQFAAKLHGLPTGQWQGPIESGYGRHLVFVIERTEGGVPELEAVRNDVRREWANARRHEVNERFYQTLIERYTVIVERSELAQGEQKTARMEGQ